jgi:hypothetical protein
MFEFVKNYLRYLFPNDNLKRIERIKKSKEYQEYLDKITSKKK